MGKSQPAAPTPPDPVKTAAAQTGTNIGTAIANATIGNANTIGPTGSTTNNVTGYVDWTDPNSGQVYKLPQYTSETKLSPEQQQLYNQQTQLGSGLNNLAIGQVGKLTDILGRPVDASGLPDVTNDFSADRTAVEKALYARLNPQLQQSRDALENQLVNQGFQRGTEAFNRAMDQANRQENDARLAVTGQGLQEQQGLFGMSQANRQRSLQELLAFRNQPLNEISALMSCGQVSLPNATPYNAPNVANTDIGSYIYNSAALAQKNYESQMQQQNAQMGGMFGLGQAGILGAAKYAPMFPSDRRLKRDIVDLGIRLLSGIKLYAYRYIGSSIERVGVMADEVARINPAAVVTVNGFLAVNYRAL